MALSNYQLVLLDNIIYLNIFAKIKQEIENRNTYTIADFITDLLVDKKTDEEDKKMMTSAVEKQTTKNQITEK